MASEVSAFYRCNRDVKRVIVGRQIFQRTLVSVLKLLWVGVSGTTNTYPKQFEHLNLMYMYFVTILGFVHFLFSKYFLSKLHHSVLVCNPVIVDRYICFAVK